MKRELFGYIDYDLEYVTVHMYYYGDMAAIDRQVCLAKGQHPVNTRLVSLLQLL